MYGIALFSAQTGWYWAVESAQLCGDPALRGRFMLSLVAVQSEFYI